MAEVDFDRRSLHERLLELMSDVESIIKQVLAALFLGNRKEVGEKVSALIDLYSDKKKEFLKLIGNVSTHREREEYIRTLEKSVEVRTAMIDKIGAELKYVEDTLAEATYQAEKKLKSVNQSETNPVNSETVIRLAYQISHGYSVAAPSFWQQGDAMRPFPTESDFAVSQLMRSQTVQAPGPGGPLSLIRQPQAMPQMARTESGALRASPVGSYTGAMPGQQRPWMSSSPRTGLYGQTATASPRGRQPSGARMTTPSPRTAQSSILQRRPSQSPRMSPLMMPMSQASGMQMPTATTGMQSTTSGAGISISLPADMGPKVTPTLGQVAAVEQMMSSDSSSSSSSGDEASPN
ncbi:Mediator protein 4 [Aphelenchoides avenae]|nr:Mediator protein 4 [Aphelenchus avenae]